MHATATEISESDSVHDSVVDMVTVMLTKVEVMAAGTWRRRLGVCRLLAAISTSLPTFLPVNLSACLPLPFFTSTSPNRLSDVRQTSFPDLILRAAERELIWLTKRQTQFRSTVLDDHFRLSRRGEQANEIKSKEKAICVE